MRSHELTSHEQIPISQIGLKVRKINAEYHLLFMPFLSRFPYMAFIFLITSLPDFLQGKEDDASIFHTWNKIQVILRGELLQVTEHFSLE